MAKRMMSLGLAAALLLAVTPAVSAARARRPPPVVASCRIPAAIPAYGRGHRVARRGLVTVRDFAAGGNRDVVIACDGATHRARLVGFENDCGGYCTNDLVRVVIAGTTVAYERAVNADHYGDTPTELSVGSVDLQTGRRFRFDAGTDDETPDVAYEYHGLRIPKLLAAPGGVVAWLQVDNTTVPVPGAYAQPAPTFGDPSDTVTTWSVVLHDAAGTRVVAQAPDPWPARPFSGLALSTAALSFIGPDGPAHVPVT